MPFTDKNKNPINEDKKDVSSFSNTNPSDNLREIQFCWNCGTDIRLRKENFCEICKAPLDENIRTEIFNRTTGVGSLKCWRCGGTTSGDVCGICGSPLTNKGLTILRPQVQTVVKPVSQMLAIYSPKDKQFKSIDITFDKLKETIDKYVTIIESQNNETGPIIFIHRPDNPKIIFEKLRNDSLIKELNLKIIIRNEQINPEEKEISLRFFYWQPETTKERYKLKSIGINIALFLATIVTVSIAGWQFAKSIYETYSFRGNVAIDIFLFAFSLLLILTIHEFGHFTISRLKKLDASLPYFIPIPPIPGFQTLGTFGALIRQKEPFATRDDLFDIGIAGPLAGFLVTIPVFLIGLKLTYVFDIPTTLPDYDITQQPTVLLADFLIYIGQFIKMVPYFDPTTQMIAMHPMMFAGWIGFMLTGLNLMPASQLDGGHTTRAVFGELPHMIISLGMALLLVLNPFTRYFGILILLMSFSKHPGSIDDITKVHWSKYLYISLGYVVAILCLPLPIELLRSYFT